MAKMIREAIDVFCGVGGLSLGLEMAGWHIVASVDKDPQAIETYKRNLTKTGVFVDDIRTMDFRKYRGIDLVTGGPPCQPFSVAGKQLAGRDDRDMVPEFIRAVRESKPRLFLMENVPGLMTRRHRHYTERIVSELEDLGYSAYVKTLSAAAYGVAQNRNRVFFVGVEKNRIFEFPEPTHGKGRRKKFVSVREVLKDVPKCEPNRSRVFYAQKPVLRPSPFAGMLVNGQGRPINLDGLCNTVPATAGGNRTHIYDRRGILMKYHRHLMNGGEPRHGEVKGVRRINVRESARIQSFPDEFVFLGPKSSQYRHVGNAVPPLLAKAVGVSLIEHLRNGSRSVGSDASKECFVLKRDMFGKARLERVD